MWGSFVGTRHLPRRRSWHRSLRQPQRHSQHSQHSQRRTRQSRNDWRSRGFKAVQSLSGNERKSDNKIQGFLDDNRNWLVVFMFFPLVLILYIYVCVLNKHTYITLHYIHMWWWSPKTSICLEWVETIRHAHLDDPCSGRCDGVTRQEKRIKTSQKEGISCINIHLGQMFYVYTYVKKGYNNTDSIPVPDVCWMVGNTNETNWNTFHIIAAVKYSSWTFSHAVQDHPDAPVTILHFWMVAYLVLLMF